jgi:hypothetical protein
MRDAWQFAAIANGAMVQSVRSALILLGTGFCAWRLHGGGGVGEPLAARFGDHRPTTPRPSSRIHAPTSRCGLKSPKVGGQPEAPRHEEDLGNDHAAPSYHSRCQS